MPERDAFGREVGDDPLADLGWGTSEGGSGEPVAAPVTATPTPMVSASAPAPPPTLTSAPMSSQPPPVLTPPGHQLLRIGRMIRFGISLLLLAVAIGGGITVINAGQEAADGIRDTFGQFGPGGGASGNDDAAPNLLRPEPLGEALALLRRETPGRIANLRLDAGSIDLQLRLAGGRLRFVHYEAGDGRPRILSTANAGISAANLFGYDDLSPKAVARAVRVARKRTGKPVDYLIFDKPLGKAGWRAYVSGGSSYVQTDGRGRYVSGYPS